MEVYCYRVCYCYDLRITLALLGTSSTNTGLPLAAAQLQAYIQGVKASVKHHALAGLQPF